MRASMCKKEKEMNSHLSTVLITLHAAEQYRSGSLLSLLPEESSWRQDNRCFSSLSPPFRQMRARAHKHTFIPPNRPWKAQPVFGFGTISSLFALPRANIYQGTTRVDFRSSFAGDLGQKSETTREQTLYLGAKRSKRKEGGIRREHGCAVSRISGPKQCYAVWR